MRHNWIVVLFIIVGQFFTVGFGSENSSDRKETRASLLQKLKTKEMIVYRPSEVKGIITVFTDLDCGYCRKLHSDIPKLMSLGIEVRYLAYPRQGLDSESYNRMVAIWCARSPREAMTMAMNGERVGMQSCHNPIISHMNLGREFGIAGTPTIVYQDGSLYSGYLSPQSLARQAIRHNQGD